MKTKFFIDFDGTMFDTEMFRDGLFEILRDAGFSSDQIKKTYKSTCLDYKYSPEKQLDKLSAEKSFDLEKVLQKIGNLYDAIIPKMIYPEIISFLEQIDREKYEIDLLSLGDTEFQSEKVKYSELNQYFDNFYFPEIQKWDYLPNLVSKDEKFVIIDDRGDAMEKISKIYEQSLCLQIIRRSRDIIDPVLKEKDNFSGTKIKSLTEALKYL